MLSRMFFSHAQVRDILLFACLSVSCLALPGRASAAYTGEYWNIAAQAMPPMPTGAATLTRTDASIDFHWGNGSPFGDAVPDGADGFVVRWTETLDLPAGTYIFSTTSDDGARVYVDGAAVINQWVEQGSVTHTGTANLASGTHIIRVEYYENTGGAEMVFSYANQAPTVSGYSPSDGGTGVALDATLELFFNKNVAAGSAGNIVIYDSEDQVLETIVPTDASKVTVGGNVVTINPANAFLSVTDYYVLIGEGAFYNSIPANPYAGIGDKTVWSFTTQETTPPDTSDDYGAKDGLWQNADQTITLAPHDPEPSSGMAWVGYCTDDGTTPCESFPGTTLTAPYQVTLSAEGTTYLRYASMDNDGNFQSTVSRQVRIDKTAPTVSAGADETHSAGFSRTASAADPLSGLDASSYQWRQVSGPGTVLFGDADALTTSIDTDEAGVYVIAFRAQDTAGNASEDTFALTMISNIGLPGEAFTDPREPADGFRLRLDDGAATTRERLVSLEVLGAGNDVKLMAVSADGDFGRVALENYQATRSWDLCAESSVCAAGTHTVYVRLYNGWGRPSRTITGQISLEVPAPALEPAPQPEVVPLAPERFVFTRQLHLGMSGEDVRQLQRLLNRVGCPLAAQGYGSSGQETTYFGILTQQAVIALQKRFDLAPYPGQVGPLTLQLINRL